jgi:hypothetical protein
MVAKWPKWKREALGPVPSAPDFPATKRVNSTRTCRKGKSMKCRKKPVVVDAIQWNGDLDEAAAFTGDVLKETSIGVLSGKKLFLDIEEKPPKLFIACLSGLNYVERGDYIIRGVRGEIYPCAADVFDATY